MSNFYKCVHFQPEELVDKQTFERFKGNIWFLFRQDALISLDGIREYFDKPVIVNNWNCPHIGKTFQYRGFRPHESPDWSQYSQHCGNAFDLDVVGIPADEVRKIIIEKKDDPHFELITCLEINISWIHFDTRNTLDRILLVKP
jgi:hypothetical protein